MLNKEDHPFAELLPELYCNDTILLEVVEVFEQMYLQNEQYIDNLPELLYNPEKTPDGFLNFLGKLVGIRNENNIFLPVQMRALIPAAYKINRKKGTRGALQELLCIYLSSLCGHVTEPVIIEYSDWQKAEMPPLIIAACPQLYKKENDFVVLLPPEFLLQDIGERARIKQLVKLYSPAASHAHIVVLETYCGLDGLSFLGVNTYL